jgi:hypothetical protein
MRDDDESDVCEPIERASDTPNIGGQSAVAGELVGDDEVVRAIRRATEAIVRNVLERDYGWYWFTDDAEALGQVVELLSVPVNGEDPLAETAGKVRALLWQSRHVSGGQSATATCSIFNALGRQAELGWVSREAYLYAMGL